MSPTFYYILHLISLFVLAGYTFYAFGAPPETKKRVMMITGIAAILALVAGFGLKAKLGYNLSEPWLLVKIVCWVGLSALAGLGYRKRSAAGALGVIAAALILVALVMVYYVRLHQG
jgi:hypothetical protein